MLATAIRAMARDFDKWWKENESYYITFHGFTIKDAKRIFFAGFQSCDERLESYSPIEPEHKQFHKRKN